MHVIWYRSHSLGAFLSEPLAPCSHVAVDMLSWARGTRTRTHAQHHSHKTRRTAHCTYTHTGTHHTHTPPAQAARTTLHAQRYTRNTTRTTPDVQHHTRTETRTRTLHRHAPHESQPAHHATRTAPQAQHRSAQHQTLNTARTTPHEQRHAHDITGTTPHAARHTHRAVRLEAWLFRNAKRLVSPREAGEGGPFPIGGGWAAQKGRFGGVHGMGVVLAETWRHETEKRGPFSAPPPPKWGPR